VLLAPPVTGAVPPVLGVPPVVGALPPVVAAPPVVVAGAPPVEPPSDGDEHDQLKSPAGSSQAADDSSAKPRKRELEVIVS
jgi:hypothetical protein